MASLIPEDDDEEEVKTLIPEDDADSADGSDGADDEIPVRSAPAKTQRRQRARLTPELQRRLDAFADKVTRSPAPQKDDSRPKKQPGFFGTIKEGAKTTARALGAAVDTYQGDEKEVVEAAKAQAEAPKHEKLAAFLSAVEDQKKKLGPDPSLWEGVKAVGSAALEHPTGAALMVAEQIPNSAAALGAGAAGAAAGSVLGPIGAIGGGLIGLTGANVALETGHGAMKAAADGSFGPQEQEKVKGEGAIKGGVISGVDAVTLGATKFITGATARAVERATTKTLADNGVDVANAAARKAALETPEIAAQVKTARELAQKASDKLGKKIARTGGALALETIGEGVGEYLGEFAATGKGDVVDAVVESLAGLSQSMGEIAYTSALNKRAMNRIFGSKEAAEKAAKADTESTGVEHEVKEHPTEPDKFVAVPKTRSAQGVPLQQDAQGNLSPQAPESGDLSETRLKTAESLPGFMHTAQDKLLLEEKRRKNAEAFARNPLILPGISPATPPKDVPTVSGTPVTQLSTNTLIYTMERGGGKVRKYAADELARREKEGVDPAIANSVEHPADAVTRIVATSAEKAQEEAGKTRAPTPAPAPETPATAPKPPENPVPEAKKPEKPVDPEKPKQFQQYAEHIDRMVAEQADFSKHKGVRQQIEMDERLTDGETKVLLKRWDKAAVKKEAPKTPATPPKADEQTIEHDGDTWRVLSTGATRADGKIFAHLASTTRGKQQKNGFVPVQISDWLDTDKLPKAQAKAEGTGGAAPAKDASELRKRASAVYGRLKKEAEADPTEINTGSLWKEQNAEQIANPGRYHPVVEEENPKGLKIGDAVIADGKRGYVASIATHGAKQQVYVVNPHNYGGWIHIDKVERTSDATPAPVAPKSAAHFGEIRKHIDALIKRRAIARQMGKEKAFDKALVAAKALLAGEDVLPARFTSAADILKGDKETADILKALHAHAEAAKEAAKEPEKAPVTPKTPVTPPKAEPKKPALPQFTKDEVLFDADGQMHRVEGEDDAGTHIRVTRNPNMLSERSVLMGADEFNRLRKGDKEYRESIKPTPKPEKPEQTEAKPEKPAKTKKPTNKEILEAHFAPGNIIMSDYRREHDRVIAFDWNDGRWLVTVEKVKKDKDGKWMATERPRTHATFPDNKDTVVERGELSQLSQLSQASSASEPPEKPEVSQMSQMSQSQTAAQQKKQAEADAKKAQAARKRVERDLHVLASTNPELMDMAGTMDLDSFTEGVNEAFAKEIERIANEYGGPEKEAVLALIADGKAVLPKEFYSSAYASAKLAYQEQKLMDARDPQLYRETLDWGLNARKIERGGEQEAQYKDGFDHALKGKTRSTLPQGTRHADGYDDARAWIKTEDGKAWFEGKRQAKQKSTGEALKRWWERAKKGLDGLTSKDMKKAWEQILRSTTRAELFPNMLADDATPGAREWLDKLRGQVATFPEYYTREMIASSISRGRYGTNAEGVFKGSHTSDRGRGKDLDWKDQDVDAELTAEREKARQAIIALYAASDAKASKDFVPDMDKRNAVINDETRWRELANGFANNDTYKYRDVYAYFNAIDARKKDKARLELTRQIAQEYQQHLGDLARSFDGLKTLEDIKGVIEARFGKPGDYKLGSMAAGDVALYHDNLREIEALFPVKPDSWDYKYAYWTNAAAREETERPEKARKDALMRPRLDKITRVMPDERKGRSITAAEFKKTFNFSDVTIGEYVTAKEAEDHLNYAYDALMSLALMLGAKPHQLSFGGNLHFSIGALGHGKYAAHFQPSHPKGDGTTVPVINVTKTRGDGSVLHEYFHAIDFLTTDPALKKAIQSVKKLLKGTPKAPEEAAKTAKNFLKGYQSVKNGGRMTRKQMAIYALKHWYAQTGNSSTVPTQFYREAQALDEGSGNDPYWSNEYEPWARASESWGYDRLKDSKQRDDYLQSDWAADGKVTKKTHRGTPYPEGAERQRLNGLMDEFVNATEWTDSGPRLKAEHVWHKSLPFDMMMKPYADAVQNAIANIDALEEEVKEEGRKKEADRKAEAERIERERLFGKTEQKAEPESRQENEENFSGKNAEQNVPVNNEPPSVPEPPTKSSTPEGDAPLSEDELSSIFDDVAAAGNEARQEKPAAPEPGEKLDSQAWTREDVFHLLNLVMQGKMVLWSGEKFATDLGLPTIQSIQGARHMGYGVFQVSTRDYKANWTAGGAMDHTPGGKAYTVLSVEEGTYPYPKEKVIQALNAALGKSAGNETAARPQKPQKPLPDLKDEQDKTAGELAAEFAKHGVKGLDKTLSGLVKLFGGGPNKLQSFPGGFDEETYAQAKVLFKEAAEEFRKSGLSFKEFVRVFFKALIDQFGNGVKPYAVRFAGEYQKTYEQVETRKDTEPAPVDIADSPSSRLADWIYGRLQARQATTWQELFAEGDRQFGGTQANGAYTPKDAYDAVELAINRAIIEKGFDPNKGSAEVSMGALENLLDLTPTQTKRTAEMDEFQQFSTPPHFALLANWVANLNNRDVYLEPSAGVGGLASFARAANVRQIIVNELSERRAALLRTLPFDRYFNENAEQIANIFPEDVKPTVVVMNPPFSSTAGRMQGARDTKNGARHIEEALKLLAPGGRLVAIVGEGMASDRSAFRDWWTKISREYNVRANIGVSGASYAKYGTTFDNQLLVIDKDGPTTGEIVTGKVDHPVDALQLLEGIRNDRPAASTTDEAPGVAGGTGRPPEAEDGRGGKAADTAQNPGDTGAAAVGGGGQRADGGQSGAGGGRASGDGGNKSDGGGKAAGKSGRGGKDGNAPDAAGSKDRAGDSQGDTANGERNDTEVRLDKSGNAAEAGAITNSVFEAYTPKKVRIEGAVPHNTPLVESAAMAAVSPPDPKYVPNLPKNVITKGLLSDAQLESVVYAGQAHSQFLRDGTTRRGFFLGDGTGVGKGRQISGVIMDNMRQGRKKAIWISKKKELIEDAKRDFGDLGGDAKLIFAQSKHKTTDKVTAKEGILFSAYPTLRSPSKAAREQQKAAGGQRRPDKDGITFERIRQIVDWAGPDFDGVIVFDESHEMGNAVASQSGRGAKPTSEQAEAGLQLQAALPKARIMYVSATGATEVTNLGYAPRLGLWGEGTPFANVNAFINAMSRSVSAMELVAQNLKQMGLYLARSLSFDGVTYEQLLHELTPFQREVYDELAKGWQIVLNNMEAAMETTGQTGGGKDTGKIKSYILSQFWSGHQRFFNQIITASQMPSIIEQIHADLKNGMAVVLQLTNTDEAGQNRAIAKAAAETKEEGAPEEELNLSPIEQLTSLIEKTYPVLQYEAYTDPDGNNRLRPVVDSKGNQVVNKEAVAARTALIEGMKSMRIPDAPLQMLINEFGTDAIAEVTGRTQRLVKDEKGKYQVEKRGANAVAADAQAFKDAKKNILVFSQAGGTGFSFHSDRRYKNRKKRAHYIMQAGWSADKAVQGFGRSHRTNQENQPVYRLVKTDIPGHKRFISSIARRLEQLGALTAGQRDTAGGSIFSAADNLESAYATHAVTQFFTKLISLRQFPQMPSDLLQQMGLTKLVNPETGALVESQMPSVTRFLNRILSLRLDTQGQVFDAFMREVELQIETARRLGTFDDGLATVRHVGAQVKQETEVYRDPSTNADVRYIDIEYQTKNEFFDFDIAQKAIDYYNKKTASSANWFKNKLSGRVAAIWATDQTVTQKDGSIERVYGVFRTSGRSQETLKAANQERITPEEAKTLWEAENAKRPVTHKNPLHMVVGGILPLWDRFNEEHVQVVRIGVDDGRRFLGRQIAGKDLADTLNKLNVQSATAKMTGSQIVQAVNEGKTVSMSNGWTLKKVRVSNDDRIEIDLGGKYLTTQAANQITESGGVYERIGWSARYFIPTNEKRGGEALDGIMKKTGSNAVAVKGEEDEAPPPAFSRGQEAAPQGGFSASGLPKNRVRSIIDAIRARWKNAPEVVILDSMSEAPDAVRAENERQLSKGATGEPEGFVYGGKVYIVASQMKTPGDVVRVLLHESLGHYGLRGLFGQELHKILKQIAALRRADVEAKAKQYGLDMSKESDRLIAAEEVLAELAQTNPQSNFVQRAIAAIRSWLRENVPGFEDMKLTDGDIVANYLVPAREFVQQGRAIPTQGTLAPAFARNSDRMSVDGRMYPTTDSNGHRLHSTDAGIRNFWRWFNGVQQKRVDGKNGQGDNGRTNQGADTGTAGSWTRDNQGRPRVFYHGTADDFSEFSLYHPNRKDVGWLGRGVYVTSSTHLAETYASLKGGYRNQIVMPLYAAVRNPYVATLADKQKLRWADHSEIDKVTERLKRAGYDGVVLEYGDGSIELVAFDPAAVKSATGNRGTFSSSNPDIRFSRSAAPAGATPATVATVATPAAPPFRERMDRVIDTLIYNFQDRFKPLKDIQKRAGLVPEAEDAALAEERYSGKVRARTDEFEASMRDPLIKAIHESGVAYDDVEEYLHALHAPSRNAAMREINPTEQELKDKVDALTTRRDALANDADVAEYLKLRRELRQAEGDIEDGIADESLARAIKQDIAQLRKVANVAEYMDALDKLKALRLVKPFQGDNTALSGMSNAESAAVLAKIDANGTRKALERVSAIIDGITSKTRQIFIDSGLETPETIEKWNEKYEHYVPLHRDEVGGSTMPRIGQGFNIRGRESKRATGSNREVTDIIAHVVAQHEAAIIRSEKTQVDQALFKFAQMHPDPALWTLDTAPMIRTVDPTSGLVVNRVDPTYKDRPEVLTLKIGGQEHTISFNESNAEGMRLAASMKNLSSQQLGQVTQMVGRITRMLATMNTTANPVFVARNFMRDIQTAYVNLTDTELADKKKEVFANVAPAIKGMWAMARGDKTSKWAIYAAEFKAAGGQTGWMEHYANIGERADALRNELAALGPGKMNAARRILKDWWNIVGDANNAVENGVRLSAYVQARKSGMTEAKAAQMAKNLTVNFNARGAKSIELNAWYMFMNASIQGSARILKALSNKQVRKIVAWVMLSGFLLDVLARSLAGDEDEDGENDYDQLPEYVKSMNFVFWIEDRPVTIPMPYGYNAFASTGRKLSEIMFRENYSPVRSAVDLVSVFLGAFSPTGQAGSGLQYVAPTVADPFVQWAENKNFAGNPLRRPQSPFGVPKPEYQMGFRSTSAPAKWLAEILNDETGGNEVRPGFINMNPALFDFAVTSTLGGAGRSYLQALSLPMKAGGDEEIQEREVPFLNIILGAKPEYQTETKYLEAITAVETARKELLTYRAKGDADMVAQIRAEHGHELGLTLRALRAKAALKELRKRELALDKVPPERRSELKKEIEEKRRATMARFNRSYQEAVAAD